MSTFDPGFADQFEELSRRVRRLEEFRERAEPMLRSLGVPAESPPTAPKPMVAAPPIAPPRVPIEQPALAPPTTLEAASRKQRLERFTRDEKPDEAIDAWSVERLVGGRWLAAAGALIVIVGVGLFLKLAYDLGWFGGLPPWAKCGAGAAFGAVLLLAGEAVRRRVNALASVGLFAAGLGAMYASAFSAHAVYGLVGPPGAMVLLTACVALGVIIGAITNLAAVAAVSLLGAYLTPILLWRAHAEPWFMPFYLLALLAVALGLSAWKGGARPWFTSLRAIAWWGTMVLGGVWTLHTGVNHWAVALVFLWLVWTLTHAERFFAALNPTPAADDGGLTPRVTFADARLVIGSLSTTAWTASLAVVVLDTSQAAPRWLPTAVLAATAAVLAFRFAGNVRVMSQVPRTTGERLGAGMLIQAAALIVATIALAFTGWPQIAAWLALGVGAVAVGRWINTRALDYYGMAVLILASATLGFRVLWDQSLPPIDMWRGLAITAWTWRIALTAGAWLIAAGLMLVRNPAVLPTRAILASIAGVAGLMLMFVHAGSRDASLVTYWALVGGGAVLMSVMIPRLRLEFAAFAALAITTAFFAGRLLFSLRTDALSMWNGLAITDWTMPAFVLTATWLVGGVLRLKREPEGMAHVWGTLGLAVALAPFANVMTESSAYALYLLAVAAGAVVASRAVPRLMLQANAIGVLLIATIAWVIAHPIHGWNSSTAALALHPGLLTALGIAAVMVLAARFTAASAEEPEARRVISAFGWWFAGALALVASSFEVARGAARLTADPAVQRSAVSIYWGLIAVGVLALGFVRRIPMVRYAGLALINIAAVKAVVIDLADAAPAWRIASFIALGLLMIGIAVGYAKLAAKVDRTPSAG